MISYGSRRLGILLLCQTENITFIYLTGLPTFVILTKTEKVSSGNVTGVWGVKRKQDEFKLGHFFYNRI